MRRKMFLPAIYKKYWTTVARPQISYFTLKNLRDQKFRVLQINDEQKQMNLPLSKWLIQRKNIIWQSGIYTKIHFHKTDFSHRG